LKGRVILTTAVGQAIGSRAAAAALTCAGSDLDRPALLLDGVGVRPRPALFASSGARRLEERLAAHRPDLFAASRGQICHVALGDGAREETLRSVLPLVRESLAVVLLSAGEVHEVADGLGVELAGVMLRADLPRDRALTALAAAGLIGQGIVVRVLARPLAWIPARRAMFGVLPADAPAGLPPRLRGRLLG